MMNTQQSIVKYKGCKVFDRVKWKAVSKMYRVAGVPLVECRDAIILNGNMKGIRLSDVFIFDPNYLTYLINNKYVDDELKSVASEVIRNQTKGSERVLSEIALRKI